MSFSLVAIAYVYCITSAFDFFTSYIAELVSSTFWEIGSSLRLSSNASLFSFLVYGINGYYVIVGLTTGSISYICSPYALLAADSRIYLITSAIDKLSSKTGSYYRLRSASVNSLGDSVSAPMTFSNVS